MAINRAEQEWPGQVIEIPEFTCPFCPTKLVTVASPDLHILACALAEICKQGQHVALAWRCERAYANRRRA